MGQAAVELPEPTEHASAPPTASADDLLSKLAGDEIDRLLAEAESAEQKSTDKAPQALAAATESSVAELNSVDSNSADSNSAATSADEVVLPPQPEPASVEPVARAVKSAPAPASSQNAPPSDVQDQLDALFNELTGVGGAGSAVGAAAPSSPSNQAEIDAFVTQASHLVTVESPSESTEANQEAIDAIVAQASTLVATEPAAPTAAATASLEAELVQSLDSTAVEHPPASPAKEQHAASAAGDPWYVRLLELLNKPFANLPEATRELMGKIAIVTAFNAAVILVYVLMFRG